MYYIYHRPKKHQEYLYSLEKFDSCKNAKSTNKFQANMKNLADILEALYGTLIIN